MRTSKKHYGSDVSCASKPAKARKGVKAASVVSAIIIASIAFIIPTTTLAPGVDAYEDSKAASYSIGNIDKFSAVITDNCVEVTTAPVTEEVTEVVETTAEDEETQVEEEDLEETSEENESTESAQIVSEVNEVSEKETEVYSNTESTSSKENSTTSASSSTASSESGTAQSTGNSGSYLLSISNPDPKYSPSKVSLSAYDRAKLERLVMGEAGSMGYTGCALVAQAIRDAMNRSNTSSIDKIISQYQYFASTSREPNADVKNAVSFIFDQNGSAVQHRVLCFYIGKSSWHETQTFITEIGGVRFFDLNT